MIGKKRKKEKKEKGLQTVLEWFRLQMMDLGPVGGISQVQQTNKWKTCDL